MTESTIVTLSVTFASMIVSLLGVIAGFAWKSASRVTRIDERMMQGERKFKEHDEALTEHAQLLDRHGNRLTRVETHVGLE